MTAHDYDKCKHFGVHIPDEPTEEQVRAVLVYLEIGAKIQWVSTNRAEVERLRGTPGEPVPVKVSTFVTCLRWVDGFIPKFWRHGARVPEPLRVFDVFDTPDSILSLKSSEEQPVRLYVTKNRTVFRS